MYERVERRAESSFGRYRGNTQNSKTWVQEHSLLIIEAKKPGKMPEDLGQARFYTMWTSAVAYIETDGEDFKIDEPVLFEEIKVIPPQDRVIQDIVFRPYRSVWLPGKVKFAGKSASDIVRLPGCCEYRIVEG